MFRNECFRCSALVLVLLAPSVVAHAQDTPIVGARFTLVEKSEPALTVTLENLRDAPLVEWQIATLPAGSGRPIATHARYRTSTKTLDGEDLAIPPHGRHIETLDVSGSEPVTAIMVLAAFADGYYEGTGASAFLQRRQEEIADLRYWIEALRSIDHEPDSGVQRVLKDRLAERGSQMKESSTAESLRHLVADDAAYSVLSLRSMIAARLTQIQARLSLIDRPMVPGPLQRSSDVPSVRITSTPSTTSRLYGVVENLRDVPIEAFGFQQYEDGRLRGGSASDFCGIRGAPIGSGPIQPRERREVALTWGKNPDGSLPDVKLHFVLFEDLTFEGSSAGRDSILKRRQQRSTSKC